MKFKYRRRGETYVRIRFWRHTGEIKGRVFWCIQSTTYQGRKKITETSKIKVEESFLISEQGYTMGKLFIRQDRMSNIIRHRS